MSSRCRVYAPINSRYVPVYAPISCPDPVNTDPKRNEAYCAPKPSRSEPLSGSEYLRKLKANNGRPISTPNNLVQIGSGNYVTTIWTAAATNAASCCNGNDKVLPAVPAVHPGGRARDSGQLTEMRGAVAGRGTLSFYDQVNRTEANTTLRRQGLAIAADETFAAPAGATRTVCVTCGLSGTTTTINPDSGCACSKNLNNRG